MIENWIRSLSARLWVTSIIALALSLSVITMIVTYTFNHYPEKMLGRREQMLQTRQVASALRFDGAGRPVAVRLTETQAWIFNAAPTEISYRVSDAAGHVLLASSTTRDGTPWIPGDLATVLDRSERVVIGGRPFDITTLEIPHGSARFYAQTATSARLVDAMIGTKVRQIPGTVRTIIVIAAIIFALTLTITVHRVLRPLREASSAAALITPRNLKTRLSLQGVPGEIKPLIQGFNEALGRLENGFMVQQQFLASAAHELQTPLTLVRGQIELQPDIADKDMLLREIDLMARQVRQLLHLAEVSEAQNFTFGEISSAEVARDVLAYLGRKADAKRVRLELDTHEAPASVWADRSALFILLKNIVENALNVSTPNSSVWLVVGAASIEVSDEGPGIHEEHLPFLFKRFWRAPGAKHDGAGLGLAICKEIALAHEWGLTVSRLASGTRFIVQF
ncbi:sensor histidine kinase [Paraburkholderia sp. BCC1885]|uniref:sensor histidine kinase n=1 Tax=Paraburkholderia sp. BCC1885 TaxID=2562669 RepID=UPI0011841980|nr:ATP-binding protein [Paraburkholderia sp. BCC1885]